DDYAVTSYTFSFTTTSPTKIYTLSLHDALPISLSIVEGMGGTCDFELRKGYPVLTNEERLTQSMRTHAKEYLGKDKVVDLDIWRSEEHTSELQSRFDLVCRLLLEKKNKNRSSCA